MKLKYVQILHNLIRWPVMSVSLPLQCTALLLKYIADVLNRLPLWWGNYLIKKFISNKKN